jgi:nicotinate phosphoribosyltransferase
MYAGFLDNDFYKFLMSQFAWKYFRDIRVQYKFKNRSKHPLLLHKRDLQKRLNEILDIKLTKEETRYLSSIKLQDGKPTFTNFFLQKLREQTLREGDVDFLITENEKDVNITVEGPWWLSMFCEIPFLATISEMHTTSIVDNLSPWMRRKLDKGNYRNLEDFVNCINGNRSLRFNDFGTRRRYSFAWQTKVLEYCKDKLEDPYKLAGTSNVHLSKVLGLKPIGTFAHELPMVLAGNQALESKDPTEAYLNLMYYWVQLYKGNYNILLTDTFTTNWLFDMYGKQVIQWKGVRHDSGDPYKFGEKYIDLCHKYNVNPIDKIIVFSDGLSASDMEILLEYFRGRVWCAFGIGTNFTNNTEIRTPNIVMKAHKVIKTDRNSDKIKSTWVAKLSDNPEKASGNKKVIEMFKKKFIQRENLC